MDTKIAFFIDFAYLLISLIKVMNLFNVLILFLIIFTNICAVK